jgi:ABC-type transporter lipoprotein component MlaA
MRSSKKNLKAGKLTQRVVVDTIAPETGMAGFIDSASNH